MMQPNYRVIAARGELLTDRIRNNHVGVLERRSELSEDLTELLDELDDEQIETLWREQGIDTASIPEHIAFTEWPEDEPLPAWIDDFEEIIDILTRFDGLENDAITVEREIPFVDIFLPIVEHSHERVIEDANAHVLSSDAFEDFHRVLFDQLVDVTAQALHIDFVRYIAENDIDVIREGRRSPASTKWYDQYVEAFFDGRVCSFFEEYSMAAKLLTVAVQQWHEIVVRFCSRVAADLDAIDGILDGAGIEQVESIETVGDPHGGNDRVLIVEFDTGDEIVYKPRSVEPEARVYEFTSWLTREFEDVPAIDVPTVLKRDDYGWAELVEQVDHTDVESLEQYYRGAGAVLAVSYVLNVTDCHCENIIAGSRSPVVVDLETVFEMGAISADGFDRPVNMSLRWHLMNRTVLGIGTLPHDAVQGNAGYDNVGVMSGFEELSWHHTNTDAMDISYEASAGDPLQNCPTYCGETVRPADFVDEMVAGFESVYDAVADSRDAVESYVTDVFDHTESRTLMRGTRGYALLLRTLTTPKYLRNGARYDLEIQKALSLRPEEPTLERETKMPELAQEKWDRIVDTEREALQRGDVPRFTLYSDERGLYFDGEEVTPELAERTGIQRFERRLSELSESDKEWQTGLLRACFGSADVLDAHHVEGEI